jgi:hypothetical protein
MRASPTLTVKASSDRRQGRGGLPGWVGGGGAVLTFLVERVMPGHWEVERASNMTIKVPVSSPTV